MYAKTLVLLPEVGIRYSACHPDDVEKFPSTLLRMVSMPNHFFHTFLGGSIPFFCVLISKYAIRITQYETTAGGGNRTHTLSPGRDFESRASANSATPAF